MTSLCKNWGEEAVWLVRLINPCSRQQGSGYRHGGALISCGHTQSGVVQLQRQLFQTENRSAPMRLRSWCVTYRFMGWCVTYRFMSWCVTYRFMGWCVTYRSQNTIQYQTLHYIILNDSVQYIHTNYTIVVSHTYSSTWNTRYLCVEKHNTHTWETTVSRIFRWFNSHSHTILRAQ